MFKKVRSVMWVEIPSKASLRSNMQQVRWVNIPITVFIGDNEKNVTLDMAKAWKNETVGEFELKVLKGHHFFINDHVVLISEMLRNKMEGINLHTQL